MQELCRVKELAASAPKAEQEAAEQRSGQHDAKVARCAQRARADRAAYKDKQRAAVAERYVPFLCSKHRRPSSRETLRGLLQ